MSALAVSLSQPLWLGRHSGSQTTTPWSDWVIAVVEEMSRASESCAESLEEHMATLPTLQDLEAQFRAEDPCFEAEMARARDRRYAELLAEVRAGRLSRITAERLKRRWSQVDLANRAGMRQPNIARLERQGASISVRTAQRLAKTFGLADYRELLP